MDKLTTFDNVFICALIPTIIAILQFVDSYEKQKEKTKKDLKRLFSKIATLILIIVVLILIALIFHLESLILHISAPQIVPDSEPPVSDPETPGETPETGDELDMVSDDTSTSDYESTPSSDGANENTSSTAGNDAPVQKLSSDTHGEKDAAVTVTDSSEQETVASGDVISQTPAAGSSQKEEATTSIVVSKSEKKIEKISVKSPPSKRDYTSGETLDKSGLSLTVKYSDGTEKTVDSGFTCSPPVLTNSGAEPITKEITVKYGDLNTSFRVTVEPIVPISISVKSPPSKTIYTTGETLNTSGLSLKLLYSNNTTKFVNSDSGISCSPNTLNSAGTQPITVTYEGMPTYFNVTVVNKYMASWSNGTGYTVSVNRTSSPKAKAATEKLSSGAAVYDGDVLSITYTRADYYTITSSGKTSITVAGNVTENDIYANARLKDLSGWVEPSAVPTGAQIIERKSCTWKDKQITGWSAWSDWQTTDPSDGVRQVEGRSVYDHTEYHYYRWRNSSYTAVYTYKTSSYNATILDEAWFRIQLPASSYGSPLVYNGTDNWANRWIPANYAGNYSTDKTFTKDVYRMEWRYKDPIYTYYVYEDSTEESTSDPSGQDNVSNVVELVRYREK